MSKIWQMSLIVLLIVMVTVACGDTKTALPAPSTATTQGQETVLPVARAPITECVTIAMHYHERPPYAETTAQGVKGLTGTPATVAFEKAGIAHQWNLTPSNRQLKIIQENTGCDCLLGWFKNAEREKFAKYTLPIYQDQPQIAIARADNTRLHSGMSVDEVLANREIVLGVKDGYSYGPFLDEKIAQHEPNRDITTAENVNMLLKVHKNRNDYFFLAPEEADELVASAGVPKEDFQYIYFSDMPEGEKRYIICSKNVSDAVIEQLNAAIAEYVDLANP